jgi:ELWxxDGT repeat protein
MLSTRLVRSSLLCLCATLSACSVDGLQGLLVKRPPADSGTAAPPAANAAPKTQPAGDASRSTGAVAEPKKVGLVRDIAAGEKSSDPALLTKLGQYVFFSADDSVHGRELWKSDGTTAGTLMVRDINRVTDGDEAVTVTAPAAPSSLTVMQNTLYFAADDGRHGKELWKSSGTAAGTIMIKDIRTSPTAPAEADSLPAYMTVAGDWLFFTANDGQHGKELWRSDGTAAGTRLVYDIHLGYPGSSPSNLTAIGDTLYFTANDGIHGSEVWKSDGTASGTDMLTDINLKGSSYPSAFTEFGDRLFFVADDGIHGRELWLTDGTGAGTKMVTDINSSPGINDGKSIASGLQVVNDRLYFSADDGRNGVELWTSDGTAAGTHMVRDINPASSNPAELTAVDDMLFFTADDGIHGVEIWKSDGTENGTVMIKDINPHPDIKDGNSYPTSLTASKGLLFFVADNGNGSGEELWMSDGSPTGTVMIRDISRDYTINAGGSNPRDLVDIDGTIFFNAYRAGYGRELYRFE